MTHDHGKKIEGITLAGRLGAGKSSTGDLLAQELGYKRFSGGKFFRDEANARGMNFKDFHGLAEKDPSIDLVLDERQKKFLNTQEHYVIDSRLGHVFAPRAFNVFLEIDEHVAAERMLKDAVQNPDRQSESHITTVAEMIVANRARVESNRKRYKELYGIEDHLDTTDCNIVVDTGNNDLATVVKIIKDAYQSWLQE
ncbi:AAA family ATPase [Candidatus Nomurabacteria bacterium]|nr:AAA family ATPase [Candidatus Nomurabacteria bacterium]